jgi:hypothetical protein
MPAASSVDDVPGLLSREPVYNGEARHYDDTEDMELTDRKDTTDVDEVDESIESEEIIKKDEEVAIHVSCIVCIPCNI